MKVFWNMYLKMVATLMNFIRATREGNWKLHLDSVKEMLPCFFWGSTQFLQGLLDLLRKQ